MTSNIGSEWKKWDLHVHTASSYDYKYNGADADKKLCQVLLDNEICAVAITDHFLIDGKRIANLRVLAPTITFFPGVELRTDKGGNNLHIILIFPDNSDLDVLEQDFNVTMLRSQAKGRDSNDTIYWDFQDIVEFAHAHNGLISIHAGKKSNGIDSEIKVTNALLYKDAVKDEIAKAVDFFEIGREADITTYQQHIFPSIGERPLIICSDNHNPMAYTRNADLWIKAQCTFEGLKQCLYQPAERIYIGSVPPVLDRVNKNAKSVIKSISVSPTPDAKHASEKWFDFSLPLNPGLVAVIGNKGSGKSALSDIIGLLCKCKTMSNASFLNDTRFRKKPKCYAKDYKATIEWQDGHIESKSLMEAVDAAAIEDAQYLPQKYIEDVCNDIGDKFQEEIDKVVFSYVDATERGGATSLKELIETKSQALFVERNRVLSLLKNANKRIIELEEKKTSAYKEKILHEKVKAEELLQRHEHEKPVEVPKPKNVTEDLEYQAKLAAANSKISDLKTRIEHSQNSLRDINSEIDEIAALDARIQGLELEVSDINCTLDKYWEKHPLEFDGDKTIVLTTPREALIIRSTSLSLQKAKIIDDLGTEINARDDTLLAELSMAEKEKSDLIRSATKEEQLYQQYLANLESWKEERAKIVGDSKSGLTHYQNELTYLNEQLESDYQNACEQRIDIVKNLFALKEKAVDIYNRIYTPISHQISSLLKELDDGIEFSAEIKLSDENIAERLLAYINQRLSGRFRGKVEAHEQMQDIIKAVDWGTADGVLDFISQVMSSLVDDDFDLHARRISNKEEFYSLLYGLQYIDVSFRLKMGGRNLEELSPGERGIVLLIFYLALSKSNMPIIVDQPEDNLDNQSVYGKLVPCICAAKKRRQVIIVTHNPNIAVACDAEQIVFCQMNKSTSHISYTSGAVENSEVRNEVVDVLEGTMPAFSLRKKKYGNP